MQLDLFDGASYISVMTEINETSENTLPEAIERFILYWGDMGGQWGVNRSVAQIHALLYLSEKPLNAEEIADTLKIARSNVSNSLKELTGWKLIRRVPLSGDRRDHFEAETELWEMVSRIAQGRKEREIDPAAAALRECVSSASTDARGEPCRACPPAGNAPVHRNHQPLVRTDAQGSQGASMDPDQDGGQGLQASQSR